MAEIVYDSLGVSCIDLVAAMGMVIIKMSNDKSINYAREFKS
jgi:hypothetical protein